MEGAQTRLLMSAAARVFLVPRVVLGLIGVTALAQFGLLSYAGGQVLSQELPPWLLQLVRIKQNVRANLAHLPNNVCLETIDRFRAPPKSSQLVRLDTLRFEIASVDGKELFALPGTSQTETEDLRNYVRSGAIGTGTFSTFLHNLFVADKARFTWSGQEELFTQAGSAQRMRQALRFDFELSSLFSGHSMSLNGRSGAVGLRGTFWADADNLDLLRLEVQAIEIPPALAMIRSSVQTIEYARVRVGRSDVLLPKSSDLRVTYSTGVQNRNLIEFSGCREFASESTIHYFSADSVPQTGAPPPLGAPPRSRQKK